MSTWRERADETFVVAMPEKGRIVLEMVLLVALVFASSLMLNTAAALVIGAMELGLALYLVRPWSKAHGGVVGRAVAMIVVLLAVIAPSIVERPIAAAESRKLGAGITASSREAGDPEWSGGIVRVARVEPDSPASPVLRVGDRIVAIGGAPLDTNDPTSDLTRRTHGNELPEDTTVSVLRDHKIEELPVHMPRVHARSPRFGNALSSLRDFASRHIVVAAAVRGVLIIALLVVLLRANGQPISSLGLVAAGAPREVLHAAWMTAGAFATVFIASIPVAIIAGALGTKAVEQEGAQRSETLGTIAAQGSFGEIIVAMIVAAAFEELTFRAFLVPRMRVIVGSWPLGVLFVSIIFGAGHVYEGLIATFQTAMLGVFFAIMMLIHCRIFGPSLAHAAFNTVMLLIIRVLASSHVLERLRSMQH
jgi:membrane protease YdiL (CAAX protease family)